MGSLLVRYVHCCNYVVVHLTRVHVESLAEKNKYLVVDFGLKLTRDTSRKILIEILKKQLLTTRT